MSKKPYSGEKPFSGKKSGSNANATKSKGSVSNKRVGEGSGGTGARASLRTTTKKK